MSSVPLAFFTTCDGTHNPTITDSKFSSFVRQLNFYGFRKVKSSISAEGSDGKWWEFKVRREAMHYICSSGRVLRDSAEDARIYCVSWVLVPVQYKSSEK